MTAKIITFILLASFMEIYAQNSNWLIRNPLPQNDFYAIEFFNDNTGFAAGSFGSFYKSTDGGNNWFNFSCNQTKTIYDLCFINMFILYAVGDSGMILYSSNSGSNWIVQNSPVINRINSIANYGYNSLAACCINGILLKTTDAGNTWASAQIASFNLNSICCVDSTNWYICGDSNRIISTTNAGISWIRSQIVPGIYDYSFKTLFFLNSTTGFAGGNAGIYITTNSGINWTQVGYSNPTKLKFFNTNCGYAVGRNMPVIKTVNGGMNWQTTGPGNHYGGDWNDVDILDTNIIFIAGSAGTLFKSTNSGSTIEVTGGTLNSFSNFSFYDVNNGFISSSNYIIRTSTGGNKWNIFSYGMNNWFEGTYIYYYGVKFNSYTNGYIARYMPNGPFFSSTVYRSTNGGQSWDGGLTFSGMVTYITKIEAVGNSGFMIVNVAAPQSQSIRRSDNGGTWNLLFSSTNQILVDLSFPNINTGYTAGFFNSTNNNFVLKTTDGGSTWTIIDLIQQNKCKQINMLDNGYGYILCDTGMVLQTTDYGNNWSVQIGSNNFKFKYFHFIDRRHGFAISYNNKLSFSSNGGVSWSLHDVGVTKNLNALQFLDSLNGYIVGDSGTVLKTTNGGLTFINQSSNSIPDKFCLSQNYPNPFNPSTTIRFEVPVGAQYTRLRNGQVEPVQLRIYDILGREVTTLINEYLKPGSYEVSWDAHIGGDAAIYPSGIYFYRLIAGDYSETKRMVLVK